MNAVLLALLLLFVATLALVYPLSVTMAAARAAHRAHGAIPALATATIVIAAWYTAPLYTFVGSIPLLIGLRAHELVRARALDSTPLPRAIAVR